NYEPSSMGGLTEAEQTSKEYTPHIEGNLVRASIDRNDNTKQAGETYRGFEQWEKDELINNLVNDLAICPKDIQDKMMALADEADEEYGRRLREGLAEKAKSMNNKEEFGQEFHPHPLGTKNPSKAVEDASNKSQDADPY
ncbi:catalase, partial [Butyricicoccus sp. 1XD8-22]